MIGQTKKKYLNSLLNKKYRQLHKVFRAEGDKIVLELLNSEISVVEVFALPKWLERNTDKIGDSKIFSLTSAELKKISSLQTPPEVIVVAELPEYFIDMNEIGSGYCLAFDFIQDPGNLGTIIRTADWFGIRNIVCSIGSVDAFSPKVVQASMGSIAGVKVHYVDLETFIKETKNVVFGTFMDGAKVNKVIFPKNSLVVFGNEGRGISEEIASIIPNRITITGDSHASAESLNVSIASAIVCNTLKK